MFQRTLLRSVTGVSRRVPRAAAFTSSLPRTSSLAPSSITLRRAFHQSRPAAVHPDSYEETGYTNALEFVRYTGDHQQPFPIYRVMNTKGEIINSAEEPEFEKEKLLKVFTDMVMLYEVDTVLENSQRQGRISFYMTNKGEEASHFGSAAALEPEDEVFAQYREAGVLLHRGFTLQQICDQCFSNSGDPAKGRQMPVHYGSKAINFQFISSPLGTQLPQAAGAAYAQKMMGSDNVSICYFGDGAASTGDFHPALNFAATLDCPVIFFCRNNGYAISTPVSEQYRGDGIVSRGQGYGMDSIRVDGNDFFAVYNSTKRARQIAAEEKRPVLIEAMTYRVGHHSTSDDSTRYREGDEIATWQETDNPSARLQRYLSKKGWLNDDDVPAMRKAARQEVLKAMKTAEAKKFPSIDHLFTDVYAQPTKNLLNQQKEMLEHLEEYKEHYDLSNYEKSA
eukprot:TRINITY_DN11389_c0_g1_i1.p1 TRINITY_DN11389_c0_g1~~TRINITY_DN11389_c0_g1_i1.p1  ORF type:complete len:473 (-),score=130.54 TRINITY_DN11389_c0_g1_i1:34-1386(-)